LEQVQGTDLDKPGELDALAKLPEPERKAKVAEAAAEAKKPASERKHVTAREPKADTAYGPPTSKLTPRVQLALDAWRKCKPKERALLMTLIKKTEEAEKMKSHTASPVS
jgi:hypothetical protein